MEFTSRESANKQEGVATDISIGGVFIETSSPAAFGVAVLIGLRLDGVGELLVPGTVRWTAPRGMGVQFGLLGARETHAIALIARQLGVAPPSTR